MKNLSYLQFYYGNKYNKESINIPEDSLVFRITNNNVQYLYKEKDVYTYNILILSKSPISSEEYDNLKIEEYYINILDNVYSEYKFNNINEFPKLEFYIVETNFNKVDMSLPIEKIELESIYRISKFKEIDNDNIYFSYVTIKNPITMERVYLLEYYESDVNEIFRNITKIKTGDRYKELFEFFCEEVMTKIIS